jgi:PAS domain-containing protein
MSIQDLGRSTKELHAKARRTATKTRALLERSRETLEPPIDSFTLAADRADTGETAGSRDGRLASPIWFQTDRQGAILSCSPEALILSRYSDRALRARLLPIMFSKGRPSDAQLGVALLGHTVCDDGLFRPRDARPVRVIYRIERVRDNARGDPVLQWTIAIQK